jgi:hypothetical protein
VSEQPPVTSGDTPAAAPSSQAPLVAAPGLGGEHRHYNSHFFAVYSVLGGFLVAAFVGFVVLVVKPGHKAPPAWSSWRPAAASTTQMASEIANHVSHQYKLSAKGGQQLVAVVPSKPAVTSGTQNISIKAIAIRKAPQSDTGIEVLNSAGSEMYTFCGLGNRCSIATGTATKLRGRLVRREALEVALYTFKFVPTVNSVIAFMPPAPGATSSSLLFLRKENFKQQLSRPLKYTLRRPEPPLPTQADTIEASTIDQLTLPSLFSYQLTALQSGGAALILDPST